MAERESKILEFFAGISEGIQMGFMELKTEMYETRKDLAPIEPAVLEQVIDNAITTEDEIYEKPGIDKWQVEEYRLGFRKGLEDFLLQNNDALFEPITGGKTISELYDLLESGTISGVGGGGSGIAESEEPSPRKGRVRDIMLGTAGGLTAAAAASKAAKAAKLALSRAIPAVAAVSLAAYTTKTAVDTIQKFFAGEDASNTISDISDSIIKGLSGGKLQDGAAVIEAVVTQFHNLKDTLADVAIDIKDKLLGTVSKIQDWFGDVEFGIHSSVDDAINRHGKALIEYLDTGTNQFTSWLSQITGATGRIERQREANRSANDGTPDPEAVAANEQKIADAESRQQFAQRELEQWGDVVSPERKAEMEQKLESAEMDLLRETDFMGEYQTRKQEQATPEDQQAIEDDTRNALSVEVQRAADMAAEIEEMESRDRLTGRDKKDLAAKKNQLDLLRNHVIPNMESQLPEAVIDNEPLSDIEILPTTSRLVEAALAGTGFTPEYKEIGDVVPGTGFTPEYKEIGDVVPGSGLASRYRKREAETEAAALDGISSVQMENRNKVVDGIEGRAAESSGSGGGGSAVINAPTVNNVTTNNSQNVMQGKPSVENESSSLRMYNSAQRLVPNW